MRAYRNSALLGNFFYKMKTILKLKVKKKKKPQADHTSTLRNPWPLQGLRPTEDGMQTPLIIIQMFNLSGLLKHRNAPFWPKAMPRNKQSLLGNHFPLCFHFTLVPSSYLTPYTDEMPRVFIYRNKSSLLYFRLQ